MFRGAISSQGILISDSFDSKSATDWISAKELMLNFENVVKNDPQKDKTFEHVREQLWRTQNPREKAAQ